MRRTDYLQRAMARDAELQRLMAEGHSYDEAERLLSEAEKPPEQKPKRGSRRRVLDDT